MVVKITSPHSLQRALNYNEKKVQKNQAHCIDAGNYLLSPVKMNFYEKMARLQDLISLNERSRKSNTLHISLNFDPSEKYTLEQLSLIARTYMEKIGFGHQPYLVYQHHDAGHPHLHIVTTNIQSTGKRIDTYNIGRNQSEKARKEIELAFGLVRASDRQQGHFREVNPANTRKAHYGRSETRRAITNVLDTVINHFKYTSLTELNAVLKLYNVAADRGREDGIVFKSGGLLYKLLDEKGKAVGMPVKASLIHSKPTLKVLQKKFEENELVRQPEKKKLKVAVDWALANKPASLRELVSALQKENVQTILRENKEGLVYGITFIDFRTKSVFNGSDLGKAYSVAGIEGKLKETMNGGPTKHFDAKSVSKTAEGVIRSDDLTENQPKDKGLLEELMNTEKSSNRVAYDLLKKKKKRNKNI